jgi:hypothetical protein
MLDMKPLRCRSSSSQCTMFNSRRASFSFTASALLSRSMSSRSDRSSSSSVVRRDFILRTICSCVIVLGCLKAVQRLSKYFKLTSRRHIFLCHDSDGRFGSQVEQGRSSLRLHLTHDIHHTQVRHLRCTRSDPCTQGRCPCLRMLRQMLLRSNR